MHSLGVTAPVKPLQCLPWTWISAEHFGEFLPSLFSSMGRNRIVNGTDVWKLLQLPYKTASVMSFQCSVSFCSLSIDKLRDFLTRKDGMGWLLFLNCWQPPRNTYSIRIVHNIVTFQYFNQRSWGIASLGV